MRNILWFLTLLDICMWVNAYTLPGCPPGLYKHGQKCYKIMGLPSTWSEAKVLCESMDAHLAEIQDPMTEQFLFYIFLNSESSLAETPLWIGASDMLTENDWIWTKSKRHMTYRNWKMRRPEALRKGHGQCLALQTLPHFEWKEIRCTERIGFVCELGSTYG